MIYFPFLLLLKIELLYDLTFRLLFCWYKINTSSVDTTRSGQYIVLSGGFMHMLCGVIIWN